MAQRNALLSVTELQKLVDSGDIDTVIISFTDIQGRLVGKRMSARLFVEDAIEHG
ncbi:MAG: glutamine synthetase, partial [Actinomycetota bacterium]